MRNLFQKREHLNSEFDDESTFELDLPDDAFELLESWHFAQETDAHEIAIFKAGSIENRSFYS